MSEEHALMPGSGPVLPEVKDHRVCCVDEIGAQNGGDSYTVSCTSCAHYAYIIHLLYLIYMKYSSVGPQSILCNIAGMGHSILDVIQ
jgi:hypothetical protein